MTTQITAEAAGTVRLGDLEVPRLGFGAMRLPGPGVWGPPTDRDEAIRTESGGRARRTGHRQCLVLRPRCRERGDRGGDPAYPDDLVLVTKLGGARTEDGTWVSG